MNQSDPTIENDPRPKSQGLTQRQLNSIISYATSVLVVCGVMMWSVFNLFINVQAFLSDASAETVTDPTSGPHWWITGIIVLLTCVIPFLIGVMLLFKTLGQDKKKNRQ